jgi:site-specific DNA recombinase
VSPGPQKQIRCGIYTRKSSEEGLDQAFNSLHAQREACEAYVKSQASEGWRAVATTYDDGGFSGGTMERPALRRLMADVDAGRIDTIVVYKVDRLTRSLADFAKIVERLDGAGASFVSVTQAFNTTNSMGRLTLNVLLSFAQFEREVTGERIRDKVAASKARGMWMGGIPPLGYDIPTDPLTRALVVNTGEADRVRKIFAAYLSLGSVSALEAWLVAEGIGSKCWRSRAGDIKGGGPFSRGALFYLLKNRVYLGQIPHGALSHPGAHLPIVDPELFDQVQSRLAAQRSARRDRPVRSASLALKGIVFDADGEPMSPSFGYGRSGRLYRYYVSAPLQQGRKPPANPRALRRVSAQAIEELVREQLILWIGAAARAELSTVISSLARVEIEADEVRLVVLRAAVTRARRDQLQPHGSDPQLGIIVIVTRCQLHGGRSWVTTPPGSGAVRRARRDPVLIGALRQSHRIAAAFGWRAADGSLAGQGAMTPSSTYERRLCRLAFMAPDIQTAIMEGRQPPSLTLDRIIKSPIPLDWAQQRRQFEIE